MSAEPSPDFAPNLVHFSLTELAPTTRLPGTTRSYLVRFLGVVSATCDIIATFRATLYISSARRRYVSAWPCHVLPVRTFF